MSGKKKLTILVVVMAALALGVGTAFANLITNGDFESGNTGFTSDYTYRVVDYYPAGIYDVGSDPHNGHTSWASYTAYSGNLMMIVNGADVGGDNVWASTANVTANTQYYFSVWIASSYPVSPAVLQFSINGTPLGGPFTASTTVGLWQQFYAPWNSGFSTTANLALINQNIAFTGNDFTLDLFVLDTARPNGTPVSEPSTLLLLGSGLLGLVGYGRKRMKK